MLKAIRNIHNRDTTSLRASVLSGIDIISVTILVAVPAVRESLSVGPVTKGRNRANKSASLTSEGNGRRVVPTAAIKAGSACSMRGNIVSSTSLRSYL